MLNTILLHILIAFEVLYCLLPLRVGLILCRHIRYPCVYKASTINWNSAIQHLNVVMQQELSLN